MTNDITILSCPICNNSKLREYGNGIYQCDVCETYFDKDENIVLTEQEWLQTSSTEQLAEWLKDTLARCYRCGGCDELAERNCTVKICYYADVTEWLKQPHREKQI